MKKSQAMLDRRQFLTAGSWTSKQRTGSGKSGKAPASRMPPHRWVMREITNIYKAPAASDEGPDGTVTRCWVTGLTRTRDGDLLLSVDRVGLPKGAYDLSTTQAHLLRSSDGGHSWKEAGQIRLDGKSPIGRLQWGLTATRTGRLLMTSLKLEEGSGSSSFVGEEPLGRPVSQSRGFRWTTTNWIVYSDDDGRTWSSTPPIDPTPFVNLYHQCSGAIVQAPDGTLVIPFSGARSREAEMNNFILDTALIRSRDDGKTWGDASVVAAGEPDIGNCYSEKAIAFLPDGSWLALFRLNPARRASSGLYTFRALSHDQGYTWSTPEVVLKPSGYHQLVTLPDGGLLHLCTGPFSLSYDWGRTWAYDEWFSSTDEAPFGVVLDDNTVFVASSVCYGNQVHGRWIRRVPSDSPEARER